MATVLIPNEKVKREFNGKWFTYYFVPLILFCTALLEMKLGKKFPATGHMLQLFLRDVQNAN
jgi:hypothetical protein